MFENLTNDNFLMYAMKAYEKPNCILSEFKNDMKRFNYLKRLFLRYRKYGDLKERLIINHLVVVYNLFGIETSTRMLFYKMSREDYSVMKTHLLFLNFMPELVRGIKGKDILSSDIPVDTKVANVLRGLK